MITYDDLPLWSAPFGLALLETIRMVPGINVLDIGSGSGFPMLELAGRMGRSCMVYGLDPSEESIRMITAKKEAKGLEFCRIVRGVAEEIPFPDEYFGLIVSNNGLNNVASLEKSLAECFRVADLGAQVVFTMNLPRTMNEFYTVFESVLIEAGLENEVSLMHAHIHEKRKPTEYLQTAITASGFDLKSTILNSFTMKYCDGTAFLSDPFIRKAFLPPWKAIVPVDQSATLFSSVETALNNAASARGELVMTVPYVCFDILKPNEQLTTVNNPGPSRP
jgi:ubiquinone/menaquinone biosynthesis C-methylase UbiE